AVYFGRPRVGLAGPAAQAGLSHPRLGFFGVIDERLDPPLLDALAQAHPDWPVVLVGPVVKIDPAGLCGQTASALGFAQERGWRRCPRVCGGVADSYQRHRMAAIGGPPALTGSPPHVADWA